MQDKSNKEIWESYLRSAVIENSMRISDDLLDDENSLIDVPRHYDMKMRSMIRKYNKRYHSKSAVKQRLKIAAAVLGIVGVGVMVLMQSHEIRSACQSVIMQVFEKYVVLQFRTDTDNDMEQELQLDYVPNGFRLVEKGANDFRKWLYFSNGTGGEIELTCYIQNRTIQIDNEHFNVGEIMVNNTLGKYFETKDISFNNYNYILWETADGYFVLSATLDIKEIKKIAENIQ